MNSGNDFQDQRNTDAELFSAVLTPHRSLSQRGFAIVMAFVSLISFVAGLAFWLMGAWPVFGFFGLDVLAIYWAFKINFARAAAREEISVTTTELKLRRISHRGHVMEWTFNPLWVRLDQEVHEEFGIERLYLASRRQRVAVASFLGPDEKESFANALRVALAAARRGPTYNPL
ncbi:MAG: DUF2244 domain-containing protein [Bradyrhizobiaceae bacterium]|nr:MAG: DUF2244 domain-containing protein [Bradyrhizobiaceae bacterium]